MIFFDFGRLESYVTLCRDASDKFQRLRRIRHTATEFAEESKFVR